MSPQKLNEISTENIQATTLEKDPVLELFEVSNKHLQNLEKNIQTFLKEHGILANTENQELNQKINSYDGNIEGVDINNIEKLKKIQNTIDYKKQKIKKNQLTLKLIHGLIQTNSKEYIDIKEIFKEAGKEDEFEKSKSDFFDITRTEQIEMQKELAEVNKKIDEKIGPSVVYEEYTKSEVDAKNEIVKIAKELNIDISKYSREQLYNVNTYDKFKAKMIQHIVENQKNLIKELAKQNEGSSKTEELQKELSKYDKQAENYGLQKETNQSLGKWLEYSMQSGVLPLAMMSNGTLRKALPMLPSVIGIGVWTRLMNGSMSEKAGAVGETVLAIAPITGTYIAYKDAMKAKGTGEKIAAWTGFAVSAGFDVFSAFLVATGVGAPAAVGTQALKVTAKESAKLAVKKLFSFFSKEVVEEAPRAYGTLSHVSKEFIKGKIDIVKNAFKTLGAKEYAKRFGQQTIKDTVEGMWSILTFKGIRELKGINNINNITFGKLGELSKPARIKLFEKMEKAGLVKEGATQRAKMAGTIEELKIIQHETLKDSGKDTIEAKEANLAKIESTKNLDNLLNKIKELSKNGEINPQELKNLLNVLKKQDAYIGRAMDTVKDITLEIDKLNNGEINRDDVIDKINSIITKNKNKLSEGLLSYYKSIVKKLSNGESFDENSGNYLLLLNKYNGQISVAAYSNNEKALKEYYELIKNGETESLNGYAGNYLKLVNEIKTIIEDGSFNKINSKKILLTYLDLIKSAETTGWGTVRTELLDSKLTEKLNNKELDNGYEYSIDKLLQQKSIQDNIVLIIENIDFSMIHSEKILNNIGEIGFNKIIELKDKGNYIDAIKLLGILTKNEHISNKILTKLNSSIEYKEFIDELVKKTNSNVLLLKLLKFSKNKNKIEEKILKNIEKNDQINQSIGISKKSMTRNQLDITLRDLQKLSDENYKKALDNIIKKVTGKTGEDGLNEFRNYIESYDVAAKFAKIYPSQLKEISRTILIGNNTSLAYKIKYLTELKKLGLEEGQIKKYNRVLKTELKKQIENIGNKDKNKLSDNYYDQIIKEIDNLENYFSSNGIGNIEHRDILKKLANLKQSNQYKKQQEKLNSTLLLLLDLDRTHNIDFLKTRKTSGAITFKTKDLLDIYIKNKAVISEDGKIIKSLSDDEVKKLKIVRDQVAQVLKKHYEFNLFNPAEYNKLNSDEDKIKYIFNTIDQQSGWKLSNDSVELDKINFNELTKTITRQLNSITNHFNVDKKIIDGVIIEILNKDNTNSLSITKKIHLLKLLEKTGIIKPSPEQKLDYIIAMKAKNADDFRNGTSELKDYSKHFDEHLTQGNEKVIEIKSEFKANPKEAKAKMEAYIKSIIDTKTPVSNESIALKKEKQDFIEGRDYVVIDGKNYVTEVYPSRYFIQQLIKGNLDLTQKEAYMEMIHNKTEFGGKSFKEYFDSVTDIETKLLMSYHDEIKYDQEVLDLLKKYATEPKYHSLVTYVLSKRNDYELIKGGTGLFLEKGVLKNIVTKEALEKNIGKKLDDEQYQIILSQIERIMISIRNLSDIQVASRDLESVLPEIKNANDFIKTILLEQKTKVSFITELLKDNNLNNIVIAARSADETANQNKQNTDYVLRDNKYHIGQKNREVAGTLTKTYINYEELKEKPKGNPIIKIILMTTLMGAGAELSANDKVQAQKDIEQKWKDTPEYKKYLEYKRLGKEKEAKALEIKTVTKIAKEVLKYYIKDFKDKYEDKMAIKIEALPIGLKTILADAYIKGKALLSPEHLNTKDLNKFVGGLYWYIDSIKDSKGITEKKAHSLARKFPELKGTKYMDFLIDIGKDFDIIAKNREDIRKNREDIRKNREDIRKNREDIRKRDEMIKKLQAL